MEMDHLASLKKRLTSDIRFLRSWVRQPRAIGSITPTNRNAARLMASLIPEDNGLPVLELGPGTGPVTQAIIEAGKAEYGLVSVEYSADFCKHLRHAFPQVTILHGDAFNLDAVLTEFGKGGFGAIASSLPLLNFPAATRTRYLEDALAWLSPGSPFIQLCYGPRPPVRPKEGMYSATPTRWVVSNVPPARFWVYRDTRSQ